jgi:hypothetical protein
MRIERYHLALLCLALLTGRCAADTMLGGFKQHDDPSNDAEVQKAAEFAVSEISKDLKLEKVLSAHKQVVAGMNYKFELQTSGGNFEATVYKGLGDAPHELKTYKRSEGGGDGKSGGQLGGSKELSADDEEVQKAAEAALKHLSSQSNSLFPYKLQEVEKASSRVHGGGTEFQLTLKAAQGDMPATTIEVGVTRTLENAEYKVGEVNKVGPGSQ